MSITADKCSHAYDYTELIYRIYGDMARTLNRNDYIYIFREPSDDKIPGYHVITGYCHLEDITESDSDICCLEKASVTEVLKELNRCTAVKEREVLNGRKDD